jgi:hypothetical protein
MSELKDKSIDWLESAMWEGREAGVVVFKEMERRLAEAQAANQKEHIEFLDGARHQADVIQELQAKIERMRPVVEAAREVKACVDFYPNDTVSDDIAAPVRTVRDYAAKEKP